MSTKRLDCFTKKSMLRFFQTLKGVQMTRDEAIKLLGLKYQNDLAKALRRSKAAINQWGEELNEDQELMVIGEAAKRGINVSKWVRLAKPTD
jgi:hypothetical protein